MKIGVRMNGNFLRSLRPRKQLLLKAGYRKVPSHCDSNHPVDEEWITNLDFVGNSHFPRFHILKDGKGWYIHYDFFVGTEKRTKIGLSQIILDEIERLRNLK